VNPQGRSVKKMKLLLSGIHLNPHPGVPYVSPQDYYKSSPRWFIDGGTKALVRSSKMNMVVYVVQAARA
jgi:hypothetical protein